mmetsp:Transcript_38023/g.98165  ORF Transcript_38023/g.98165 Transcript_38023/m.98165 type:complete len:214 (-) Transcript_38023:539-1180(-)
MSLRPPRMTCAYSVLQTGMGEERARSRSSCPGKSRRTPPVGGCRLYLPPGWKPQREEGGQKGRTDLKGGYLSSSDGSTKCAQRVDRGQQAAGWYRGSPGGGFFWASLGVYLHQSGSAPTPASEGGLSHPFPHCPHSHQREAQRRQRVHLRELLRCLHFLQTGGGVRSWMGMRWPLLIPVRTRVHTSLAVYHHSARQLSTRIDSHSPYSTGMHH